MKEYTHENMMEFRFENDLTQSELANIMGATRQTINYIEKGKIPFTKKMQYKLGKAMQKFEKES